jgi:hypothetical protein
MCTITCARWVAHTSLSGSALPGAYCEVPASCFFRRGRFGPRISTHANPEPVAVSRQTRPQTAHVQSGCCGRLTATAMTGGWQTWVLMIVDQL